MPFTLLCKRPAISAPSIDGCSSSTAISNDGAAHIKNKSSCKRKKQCTQSTVNSKAHGDESLAADEGDNNYTAQDDKDGIRFGSSGNEGGLGELYTGTTDSTPLKFYRAPKGVESGKQSVDVNCEGNGVEAANKGGDFSFDNGSNESVNGDGLDELGAGKSADAQRNNEPPTTSKSDSIKLCTGNRVNGWNGPSPTNVEANLSSFTRDAASPVFDNNNDDDQDQGEQDLPSFHDVVSRKCVGESIEVFPKKGKAHICFVCCIL